jgi:hypothetical protein
MQAHACGRMRGQASAEHMLLFMVSLSVLMLSLAALSKIRADASEGIASARFQSSAGSIASAVREVCALGAGNGRALDIEPGLALESEPDGPGWVFRISDENNRSMASYSPCPAGTGAGLGAHVYVENKEGEIIIRER